MQEHPDLAATGASMRAAWRAEQEAATRDAAEAWQHGRTLVDVLVDAMHRGDRVAVVVGSHRVVGEIADVGPDVVSIMTLGGRVDVHLDAAIPTRVHIDERARFGGHRSDGSAPSFRARLLDREQAGEEISLATLVDPEPFDGTLQVGTDVVLVRTRLGAEHYFPIATVASITARMA